MKLPHFAMIILNHLSISVRLGYQWFLNLFVEITPLLQMESYVEHEYVNQVRKKNRGGLKWDPRGTSAGLQFGPGEEAADALCRLLMSDHL